MIIDFDIDGVENVVRQLRKTGKDGQKRAEKRIEKLAEYTKQALHNAPKEAKRIDPQSKRKNANYRENKLPNRVYFPNPHGGVQYSGMTVEEYIASIKGGYVARGSGSFQKEKVQTRVRGTYPAGTYSEKNQRPGEFFTKGTGRFSERERARIEKIRAKERALDRSMRRRDRKSTAKQRARLRELEAEAEAALQDSKRKKHGRPTRLSKAREKYETRVAELEQKRKKKLSEFRDKNRRYRIVAPSDARNYSRDPLPKTLFRVGGKPGGVPKTWTGHGNREKFLARNWKQRQLDPLHVQLEIRGEDPDDSRFLHRLEYGGMIQKTSRFIVGYLVEFRDESASGKRFSHRRISFRVLWSDDEDLKLNINDSMYVPGRPFVRPTIENVKRRFNRTNS